MSKLRKRLLILIIAIIVVIASLFVTYKVSFEPKVQVTSISSETSVDNKALLRKFIPNNIDLNFSGIKLESNASFTEEEITNLIVAFIKSDDLMSQKVTGVQAVIDNNHLLLYINFNYNGIPVQGVLDFTISAQNNEAILHYNSGKIGFINISKKSIFDSIENGSVVTKDENTNDIFVSLYNDYGISIKKANLNDSKLNLEFQLKFNFNF